MLGPTSSTAPNIKHGLFCVPTAPYIKHGLRSVPHSPQHPNAQAESFNLCLWRLVNQRGVTNNILLIWWHIDQELESKQCFTISYKLWRKRPGSSSTLGQTRLSLTTNLRGDQYFNLANVHTDGNSRFLTSTLPDSLFLPSRNEMHLLHVSKLGAVPFPTWMVVLQVAQQVSFPEKAFVKFHSHVSKLNPISFP